VAATLSRSPPQWVCIAAFLGKWWGYVGFLRPETCKHDTGSIKRFQIAKRRLEGKQSLGVSRSSVRYREMPERAVQAVT
jgi:hypothetical protein